MGKLLHCQGAAQRTHRMVFLHDGGREKDRQAVADNPCECAVMGKCDGNHAVEVPVDQAHRGCRVRCFHQRGEAFEVGEEETALLAHAAES